MATQNPVPDSDRSLVLSGVLLAALFIGFLAWNQWTWLSETGTKTVSVVSSGSTYLVEKTEELFGLNDEKVSEVSSSDDNAQIEPDSTTQPSKESTQ
jgi:hypothetical protein